MLVSLVQICILLFVFSCFINFLDELHDVYPESFIQLSIVIWDEQWILIDIKCSVAMIWDEQWILFDIRCSVVISYFFIIDYEFNAYKE